MAILTGIATNLRNSAGNWTYYQCNGQTIARQKISRKGNDKRSANQLIMYSQWGNLVNFWKRISGEVDPYFCTRGARQTHYNAFMASNLQVSAVFLTKRMAQEGGCVVAPYTVSCGGLEKIEVSRKEGIHVTNLSLGGLTIDATTTIGQLSAALRNNNRGYREGDRLVYYRMNQLVDSTGLPYVRLDQSSLTLKDNDGRQVWQVLSAEGFSSKDGFLAAGSPVVGGEVWVHARFLKKELVEASTQKMVCNNDLQLATYVSREALDYAFESYGGITKRDRFTTEEELSAELDEYVTMNATSMGIGIEEDDSDNGNGEGSSQPSQVTITAVASPSNGGGVSGGGSYPQGAEVSLKATPQAGYRFARWSDGSTSAQRTVTATASQTYTAIFESTGGSQGGYDSGN